MRREVKKREENKRDWGDDKTLTAIQDPIAALALCIPDTARLP